jgi:hypothetical protein
MWPHEVGGPVQEIAGGIVTRHSFCHQRLTDTVRHNVRYRIYTKEDVFTDVHMELPQLNSTPFAKAELEVKIR